MMQYRTATLLLLTSITLTFSAGIRAQNLVINGSFEELDKKPKEPGEVMQAKPWIPATITPADLYSESAKDERIEVPRNAYGEEKAKDGENYAGILIYSHNDKEPRSYITQKLKYPMLAGEHYCVQFHVSFADLSKYASNNIGCYISLDSIGSEDARVLPFKPQIINSTNRIFEKQWSWEPICRIYIADGGEQFITIGNFAPQEEILTKSVRRPQGFTQTQLRDGYYYIDDISITPNATPENCKCEPGNFAFANLNKEESTFETAEKDVPKPVIIGTTGSVKEAAPAGPSHKDVQVKFALGKSNLEAKELTAVNEAIEFLKANESVKVELIGHQDETEKVVKGLDASRIEQVSKYLESKGIDGKRISSKPVNFSKPLDTSGDLENRKKNMVVEMKFTN